MLTTYYALISNPYGRAAADMFDFAPVRTERLFTLNAANWDALERAMVKTSWDSRPGYAADAEALMLTLAGQGIH